MIVNEKERSTSLAARRLVAVAALVLTMLVLTLLAGSGGSLAPASATVPASVQGTVSSGALAGDVGSFRADVRNNLRSYLTRYGDRLSAAERARMTALVTKVDRELTLVQTKVARAERVAKSGASRQAKVAAAHDASVTFDAAHASALVSLAEVQPILQPKLSLFEGLSAKRDLDAQLSRYEQLGDRIHAFEAAASG